MSSSKVIAELSMGDLEGLLNWKLLSEVSPSVSALNDWEKIISTQKRRKEVLVDQIFYLYLKGVKELCFVSPL